MVVLLNSENVSNSHWVGEELTIIKSYRLGLLELRLPDGTERADIDQDFTLHVYPSELEAAGAGYPATATRLNAQKLAEVVQQIKTVHGRALHRRKYELMDNLAATLAANNKTALALPNGTFLVPGNGRESIIAVSPRPPELGDFCSLHVRGSVGSNRQGCLITPAPFFLAHRAVHVGWLGGLCNIQHVDEAQIAQLAESL